jgi:6-pyruvoyltetrahydropterin/6-carboxytetrahydropterin synthase
VVEVSARGPLEPAFGRAVDTGALDRLVERYVLQPFDHHNLNVEVEAFRDTVPTAESLAMEIGRRLKHNWKTAFPGGGPRLEKIRIEETPRNACEIGADEIE